MSLEIKVEKLLTIADAAGEFSTHYFLNCDVKKRHSDADNQGGCEWNILPILPMTAESRQSASI